MNLTKYQKMLKENVRPSVRNFEAEGELDVQHYRGKHSENSTKDWLRINKHNVLGELATYILILQRCCGVFLYIQTTQTSQVRVSSGGYLLFND